MKKEKLCFDELSKKKKKEFLSNDLTERIIRIEQRVSARFGKLIFYNETEYYKSLSPKQKKKFEQYLNSKKAKKLAVLLVILFPILALFLLNLNFTGNAVKEQFGDSSILGYMLIALIIIIFLAWLNFIKRKKAREKRFKDYFNILEDIVYKQKGK